MPGDDSGVPRVGQGATQIRRVRPEDCSEVARVLAEAFAEYRLLYTVEAFRATTPDTAEIAGRLDMGPVWIAIQGSTVVGTVSGFLDGDGFYIRSMAVLPAGRGHGVGRRLMEHAQAFATTHGCGRIYLSTTPFLSQAIRLYESFGFRQCGTANLHGTPLLTLEKALPADRKSDD